MTEENKLFDLEDYLPEEIDDNETECFVTVDEDGNEQTKCGECCL